MFPATITIDALRLYLLAGLALHKIIWEVMKRRQPQPPAASSASFRLKAVKIVKAAVLAGLLLQTVFPQVFPIAADPKVLRAAGAALFSAGLLVAVLARLQLGSNWADIESATVTTDQSLILRGPYRYIRHPIYVGDLLLLAGLELALNSWLVLVVAAMTPAVLLQAVREEQLLVARLPGYPAYCGRTKRFIPFVV